jgi:hypothetical protein
VAWNMWRRNPANPACMKALINLKIAHR